MICLALMPLWRGWVICGSGCRRDGWTLGGEACSPQKFPPSHAPRPPSTINDPLSNYNLDNGVGSICPTYLSPYQISSPCHSFNSDSSDHNRHLEHTHTTTTASCVKLEARQPKPQPRPHPPKRTQTPRNQRPIPHRLAPTPRRPRKLLPSPLHPTPIPMLPRST